MDVYQGTQSEESYIATTKSPIISTSSITKHKNKDRAKSKRVYCSQFDYNTHNSFNKQPSTCFNSTTNNDATNHLNNDITNHPKTCSNHETTKCFNGTNTITTTFNSTSNFTNNTIVTYHNNNNNTNNKSIIKCSICNKTFNNSSALAKHKLIHSNERKYTCPQCGKSFKRQDHLNGHMLTHADKKPYQCQLQNCDKSYCDSRSLKRHYDNQHRDFLLQQQQLTNQDSVMLTPKLTPKSASFTKVESIFSFDNISEEPFSTSYFQMSPVSPNLNRDNIKAFLFDEYKPMECKVCSKRFKNTSALNGHMRLHGGFMQKSKTTECSMLPPGNTQNKPSNIPPSSDNKNINNNANNNNNGNINNNKNINSINNTNNNSSYVKTCDKAMVERRMENEGEKFDEKTLYDKNGAEDTPYDDLCDNDGLLGNKDYGGVQTGDKLANNDGRLGGIKSYDNNYSTSDKIYDDKQIEEVFPSDNIKHEYYCFDKDYNNHETVSKVDFNTELTATALQDISDKDVIDEYDNKEVVENFSPQIADSFNHNQHPKQNDFNGLVSGYDGSSGQGCGERAIKIEPQCINEGKATLFGKHVKKTSPDDSEIVDIIISLSEDDHHIKKVYNELGDKIFRGDPTTFAFQHKCLNDHFNNNLPHGNLPHSDLSHEQPINNVIINEKGSGFNFDDSGHGGKYQEPCIFNFPPQECISNYSKLLESNNINKSSLFSPIANKLSELDIMSPRTVGPIRSAIPTSSVFSSRPVASSQVQMVPQAIDVEKEQASLKVEGYLRQLIAREQQENGGLDNETFESMDAQEMVCDGAITSPHLTSLSHHTLYQNDTSDMPHFHNDSYIHNSQKTSSFDNFVDQRMYKSMELPHEFQTNQPLLQQKNVFEEKQIQFYQQKYPQNLHSQHQVYYQNLVASGKQQPSPRQHAVYRHLDNSLQNQYGDEYSANNPNFNISNKLKRKFKPQPLVIPHSANNYISESDLPYLNASPSHPYTPIDPGNLLNRHCGHKNYQSFSSIDTKRSNSPPPVFRRRMHSPSFTPPPVPAQCWSSSRPPPQSAPITNKRQYTFEFQEVYQGADNSPHISNFQ